MPRCAAFVDDLRSAFGVEEINTVIKRGLHPECEAKRRVYFAEAGHVLGRQAGVLGVEVEPVLPQVSIVARKGSR